MDVGEDSGMIQAGHLWDIIVEHELLPQQDRDIPFTSKYISFAAEKTATLRK